jgi:hypothetical protein
MLKLARNNALGHLGSFVDGDGNEIKWHYIKKLQQLQQQEGLNLANKLSMNHLKYEKLKMNVRLAAQTLSSFVANAIEFADVSTKHPSFRDSQGTLKFIRTIDPLFDMINSRNPIGLKRVQDTSTSPKQGVKDTWQNFFSTAAKYLLSLKTNTPQHNYFHQLHVYKTFIVGFVTCIKSKISMATQMFCAPINPEQNSLPGSYQTAFLMYTIQRRME